jgi:hypothetical protein
MRRVMPSDRALSSDGLREANHILAAAGRRRIPVWAAAQRLRRGRALLALPAASVAAGQMLSSSAVSRASLSRP